MKIKTNYCEDPLPHGVKVLFTGRVVKELSKRSVHRGALI